MDKNWRIRTSPPWQWLDQAVCGPPENVVSAMNCYFPKAEARCPGDLTVDKSQSQSNPIASPFQERCPGIIENKNQKVREFRAASTEYLFQSVNPALIQEAERQLNLVFPRGQVPPDLITVQIRWGDKKEEMELLPAEAYVKGVERILEKRQKQYRSCVCVSSYRRSESSISFSKSCASMSGRFILISIFTTCYHIAIRRMMYTTRLLKQQLKPKEGLVWLL